MVHADSPAPGRGNDASRVLAVGQRADVSRVSVESLHQRPVEVVEDRDLAVFCAENQLAFAVVEAHGRDGCIGHAGRPPHARNTPASGLAETS
eukprot:2774283-Rhodomonas_salina.1